MEQEKFSNEMPEEVLLVPKPRRIVINPSLPQRAYGLFDTKTGTQVKDFVKGNGGTIEFTDLNPDMHYDVGVIEGTGDEKPEFAIIWTQEMRDDTESFLSNSDNLPIEYPSTYTIRYKHNNSGGGSSGGSVGNPINNSTGVYDLVDDKGEKVGQVAQLSGDKPWFNYVKTFRMKDDTQE